MKTNTTKRLAEASILIAFATVLSMLKLVDMPYGGSVTAASMLPIIVVAYRHGLSTGLASGLVFALIQQLLGLNTLSYVTGWQSIVAVIILDYVLAFTVVGLAGVLKGKIKLSSPNVEKKQSIEIALGALFVCILRYILHTVAGATVWAGLSIPTEAALVYSIGYNATYMIPETIVTVIAGAWVGSVLDLSKNVPTRFTSRSHEIEKGVPACEILTRIAVLVGTLTVMIVTVLIAPGLQNPESGEFDFSGIGSAPWIAVAVIGALGAVSVAVLCIVARFLGKKQNVSDN